VKQLAKLPKDEREAVLADALRRHPAPRPGA